MTFLKRNFGMIVVYLLIISLAFLFDKSNAPVKVANNNDVEYVIAVSN